MSRNWLAGLIVASVLAGTPAVAAPPSVVIPYNVGTLNGNNTWSGTNNFTGSFSIAGEPIIFNSTYHTASMGTNALPNPASGNASSIAIGDGALQNNATGDSTTAIGHNAGNQLVDGRTNVFVGYRAGYSATSASSVTCIGAFTCGSAAGISSTWSGVDDVFIGEASGLYVSGASSNFDTCVGYNSCFDLVDGDSNSVYGDAASALNQHGGNINAFGVGAYKWGRGSSVSFFGVNAGAGYNFSFTSNGGTAQGSRVIPVADTSAMVVGDTIYQGACFPYGTTTIASISANVSITVSEDSINTCNSGSTYYDIPSPPTGTYNAGFGNLSLNQLQGAAQQNSALGGQAGRYVTTGSKNSLLGYLAGGTGLTTGSQNICIGYLCTLPDGTASNQISLANNIYCTSANSLANIKCGWGTLGSAGAPAFTFEIGGTFAIDAPSAASGTPDTLCWNTSTKEVTHASGTCQPVSGAYSTYTWAGRPSASGNSGVTIEITDVGPSHCLFTSDGTSWVPQAVCIIGRSAAQLTHTGDTAESQFVAVTIPAGLMGLNSGLRIQALASRVSGTAGNLTLRARWSGSGGTAYISQAMATTNNSAQGCNVIRNRNSASSQVGAVAALACSTGLNNTAPNTDTVNTANASTVYISGQCANSGDTIGLDWYEVALLP